MEQKILNGHNQYDELNKWMSGRRVLVVCGSAYPYINKPRLIIDSHNDVVYFNHYKSNPVYESVVEGIELFHKEKCNAVMAVGGGSAIDVAKCIKIFSTMDDSKNYLQQEIANNTIPLFVIPTTAGTGSEATRYAVIYFKGEKQSITSDYCIPESVLLDPDNLVCLPEYQRKATMMDALSHALESMWSINSTPESIGYSANALELFAKSRKGYLDNTSDGNYGMQMAAHWAGKAINISQTTAGHAMCYKITSLFGCAHGHAAMLCNYQLFPWLVENADRCKDPRGVNHLKKVFSIIAESIGAKDINNAVELVRHYFDSLELDTPSATPKQVSEMTLSVNAERLRNSPVIMNEEDIRKMYYRILKVESI